MLVIRCSMLVHRPYESHASAKIRWCKNISMIGSIISTISPCLEYSFPIITLCNNLLPVLIQISNFDWGILSRIWLPSICGMRHYLPAFIHCNYLWHYETMLYALTAFVYWSYLLTSLTRILVHPQFDKLCLMILIMPPSMLFLLWLHPRCLLLDIV